MALIHRDAIHSLKQEAQRVQADISHFLVDMNNGENKSHAFLSVSRFKAQTIEGYIKYLNDSVEHILSDDNILKAFFGEHGEEFDQKAVGPNYGSHDVAEVRKCDSALVHLFGKAISILTEINRCNLSAENATKAEYVYMENQFKGLDKCLDNIESVSLNIGNYIVQIVEKTKSNLKETARKFHQFEKESNHFRANVMSWTK